MKFRTYALAAISLLAAAAPAQAATLTFDATTPGTTLTTYTQDGYTVARESGQFLFGEPNSTQPTNYLLTGYNYTGLPGIPTENTLASLNITAAGSLFTLGSFLYAGYESPNPGGRADGKNSITVTGYLAGVQAFQQEFLPGVSASYLTLSLSAGTAVDRLNVATNGRSIALDSFVVDAATATAAVPEPATWAMMIAGFGMVGGTMRRRQRVMTKVAYA